MEEIKKLFSADAPAEAVNKAPREEKKHSKPRQQREKRSRQPKAARQVADPSLADAQQLAQLAVQSEKLISRNGVGQYLAWLKSTNSSESIALYQRISKPILEELAQEQSSKNVVSNSEPETKEEGTTNAAGAEVKTEAASEQIPSDSPEPDLLDAINRRPSSFHQDILITVLEVIRSIEAPKKSKAPSVKAEPLDAESDTSEKPRRIIVETTNSEAFAGAKTDA